MKLILQLEMLGLFLLSVFLFDQLGYEWWLYVALFLVPDFGMVGYVINSKVGAWTYNFTHHAAVSVACIILGIMYGVPYLELAGIIILGHFALDRMLGFGLKYQDSFKHTHLGWLK